MSCSTSSSSSTTNALFVQSTTTTTTATTFAFFGRSSSTTTGSHRHGLLLTSKQRQMKQQQQQQQSAYCRFYCYLCSSTSTSSTRIYASTKSSESISFKTLVDKTLVSVQDCIDAWYIQQKIIDDSSTSSNLIFIDGTWFHKGSRDGKKEYMAGPRIPGSIHIDIDDLSCQHKWFPMLNPKNLKRMLPPPILFAAAMDYLGITHHHHIIFYGRQGCYFLPRLWYMFLLMGHSPNNIHLMQGSLDEWITLDGPIDNTSINQIFKAQDLFPLQDKYNYSITGTKQDTTSMVCDLNYILNKYNSNDTIIIDPRGNKSFSEKGHIPGAINIPYKSLIDDLNNTIKLKTPEELKKILNDAGVNWSNQEQQIICSCGTGVSVCNILLALHICGRDILSSKNKMYDGSWNEYGSNPSTPKEYR